MNRPSTKRALCGSAHHAAQRSGHSALGLVLALGLGVVGMFVVLDGDDDPLATARHYAQQEVSTESEPAIGPDGRTAEERAKLMERLNLMVSLREEAEANIELLSEAQRAEYDALGDPQAQLTYLVKREIERVRVRGQLLSKGLGEAGEDMRRKLQSIPGDERLAHTRRVQNSLDRSYSDAVERLGDSLGLPSNEINQAKRLKGTRRRIPLLADMEGTRLRNMRGENTRPEGMNEDVFEQLVSEEDPFKFLELLNSTRLELPSDEGDPRDAEASNSQGSNSGGARDSNGSTRGVGTPRIEPDGANPTDRTQTGNRGAANLQGGEVRQPGSNQPSGNSPGARSQGGNNGGARSERPNSDETPDDSGGTQSPEGVPNREGAQNNSPGGPGDATPERPEQRDTESPDDAGALAADPQRGQRPGDGSSAAEGRGTGERAPQGEGAERPQVPSIAGNRMGPVESGGAAERLIVVLRGVPKELTRALEVIGREPFPADPQKALGEFADQASALRDFFKAPPFTDVQRETLRFDEIMDVFLVVAVREAGGLDVSREKTILDVLIRQAEQRAAANPPERAPERAPVDTGDVAGGPPAVAGDRPTENAQPQAGPERTSPAGDPVAQGSEGSAPRPVDPNADRGAQVPEGSEPVRRSTAELRQQAEREMQAVVAALKERPAVAQILAEKARFTAEDAAQTRELPPAEGLRVRYQRAAKRVVDTGVQGQLLVVADVQNILRYEPGYLALGVRKAAGEDVERDLVRLRQLSADANARAALGANGVPGSESADPDEQQSGDTAADGTPGGELEANSAESPQPLELQPARAGDQSRASGDVAVETEGQPNAAGAQAFEPSPGLAVDQDSPELKLPKRTPPVVVVPEGATPAGSEAGSGAQRRPLRIPPHLRNRRSARDQVEAMGDRLGNTGQRNKPSSRSGDKQDGSKKEDQPKQEEPKSSGDQPREQGSGNSGSGRAGAAPQL